MKKIVLLCALLSCLSISAQADNLPLYSCPDLDTVNTIAKLTYTELQIGSVKWTISRSFNGTTPNEFKFYFSSLNPDLLSGGAGGVICRYHSKVSANDTIYFLAGTPGSGKIGTEYILTDTWGLNKSYYWKMCGGDETYCCGPGQSEVYKYSDATAPEQCKFKLDISIYPIQ